MKTEANVTIKSASGLKAADLNGKSDPYVVIKGLREGEIRTPTVQKSLDPVWDFECSVAFAVHDEKDSRTEGGAPKTLELSVWDEDRFTKDDPLGKATLNLGEFGPTREARELVLDLDTQGSVTLVVSWPHAPAPGRAPDAVIQDAGSNSVSFPGGCFALSADGKTAAQAYNSTVALFDLANGGSLLGTGEETDEKPAAALAFSPDGSKVASVTYAGALRVFSVPTAQAGGSLTSVTLKPEVKSGYCKLLWTADGSHIVHVGNNRTTVVNTADDGSVAWVEGCEMATVDVARVAADVVFGVLSKVLDEEMGAYALEDGSQRHKSVIDFPPKDGKIRKPEASAVFGSNVITASVTVGTEKGPRTDLICWDAAAGTIVWQEEKVFVGNLACTGNGTIVFEGMPSEWGPSDNKWHSKLTIVSASSGATLADYELGSGEEAPEDSSGSRVKKIAAGPGEAEVSVLCEDGQIRVFEIKTDDSTASVAFKSALAGVDGSDVPGMPGAAPGVVVASSGLDDKKGVQVWRL
jgi:C2 domain